MPRIKEYTPDVSPFAQMPGRAASGDDFGGQIGEALIKGGAELEQAHKVLKDNEDRQDVSNVHAALAKARAEWTVHLHERAQQAKPGDSTFMQKFTEDFGKYVGDTRLIAKTQKGQMAFDEGAATLGAHFYEQAGLFQAKSIGTKAVEDYKVTLDAGRNTLLTDPTQFNQVLAQQEAALMDPNGMYARMPAAKREELLIQTRKEMALSFGQGLIRNGAPEILKKQLSESTLDKLLDADAKNKLMADADVAIKEKSREAEHQANLAKAARKVEQEKVMEQIVIGIANGKIKKSDIINADLPAVGQGSKEHFLNVLHAKAKEAADKPIKTVPSVMLGLYDDIRQGKVPSTDVIDRAYLNKTLSWEDKERLTKAWQENRTPDGERMNRRKEEFFTGVKPHIDRSNPLQGKIDAPGSEAMYRFRVEVDNKMAEYRRTGKDPYDLLDPSKPDYMGKPDTLAPFQKTIQQSMQDVTRRIKPSAALPPDQLRKPGETIADWRRRTAGQ